MKSTALLTFLLGLFWGLPVMLVQAQGQAEQDVMYLRDGSILRGKIIDQIPGQMVSIQTWDGTVFKYPSRDILRLTRELAPFRKILFRYNKDVVPIQFRKKGLAPVLSVGLAGYQDRWGPQIRPQLHARLEYRWHHAFETGIGIGLDTYDEGVVMPYYAHVGGELKWGERYSRPYYFAQIGYSGASSPDWQSLVYEGRYMLHAGLGLRRATRSRKTLTFTVSYKAQSVYQEFEEIIFRDNGPLDPVLVKGTRLYQRIVYQLQISF